MERRDFLKISALTTGTALLSSPISALAETIGSEKTGRAEAKPDGGFVPNPKIARKIEGYGPMDIRKIKINVGAKRPFSLLHISDSHLVLTDSRNDDKKAQLAKGLPTVILMHIPFYTPKLYDHTSHGGTKFSYLCGAPSDTEREDNLTQKFVKWLKEQPQLKAILTGHLHEFWQEQFSPTAVQYVVGGAFKGDAYQIRFV